MCYHHLSHIWFSSFLLYFGGLCRGKGYPRSLLNFYFPHKNVFKLLESCFLLVQFSVVWNTCTQFLPLSPHLSLSLSSLLCLLIIIAGKLFFPVSLVNQFSSYKTQSFINSKRGTIQEAAQNNSRKDSIVLVLLIIIVLHYNNFSY